MSEQPLLTWTTREPRPRATRALVVAPHPDDEVFGAGGLMVWLASLGCELTILALTDGEASHPRSSRIDPSELTVRRGRERQRALRRLGIDARVVRAALPDASLADHRDEAAAAITALLAPADLCLAPWRGDPHDDHVAAAEAAADACARCRATLWETPI